MGKRIVLASASPRRRELLRQIGLEFEVIPSAAEEVIEKQDPAEIVQELSLQKARDVAGSVGEGIVIGADTVVCQDGRIMGKPADREDARAMIRTLQGRWHSVFTGVTVIAKEGGSAECSTFFCETRVHISPMSEQEIERYLDSGEPMDKAGAYGIQGMFAAWVERIDGDYSNVVGLPLSALYQTLKKYI